MDYAEFACRMAEAEAISLQARRLAETTGPAAQGQLRLPWWLRWAVGFALLAALVCVGMMGYSLWDYVRTRHERAALLEALQTETQTLAAQTEALREQRRSQP